MADTSGRHWHEECTVSMSDTSGELLFYGSNDSLFTADHQFMPNGELNNIPNPIHMVALSKPGSNDLYYVLYPNSVNPNAAQYAIIDMSLNGGKGEVVQKDQDLIQGTSGNRVTEKVAAVQHCNGEDVWVLFKKQDETDLRVWRLTASGWDGPPVLSSTTALKERGSGAFRFSPKGEFGAAVYDAQADDCRYTIVLYRFDDCTGTFSDPIEIPFWGGIHLAFSPDGGKLYAGTRRLCMAATPGVSKNGKLVQYDLEPYHEDSIIASETVLEASPHKHFYDMRIGLDGRIYVADLDCTEVSSGHKLGVIEHPNKKGMASSYLGDTLFVTDEFHGASFPAFLENLFRGAGKDSAKGSEGPGTCGPLRLYPTPSTRQVTFHTRGECPIRKVRVFDPRGRVVRVWEGERSSVSLSLNGLRSGLYLLKADLHEGSSFVRKIVKE